MATRRTAETSEVSSFKEFCTLYLVGTLDSVLIEGVSSF